MVLKNHFVAALLIAACACSATACSGRAEERGARSSAKKRASVILAEHGTQSGKPVSRIVEVSGGERRRVALVDGLVDGLRLSPDGRTLAFVEPSGSLFVITMAGGVPRRVAGAVSGWPTWSPAGALLWVERQGRRLTLREERRGKVAVSASWEGDAAAVAGWDAGRGLPLVFVPTGSRPTGALLSPDGRGGMTRVEDGVRFAGSRADAMLLLEAASQSTTRAAEPDPYRVSVTWSVVGVSGGRRSRIKADLPSDSVALSHDGKRIAYSRMDKKTGVQLFVSGTDGSAEKRLTSLPSCGGYVPVWSSDDRFIVFSAIQTQGTSPGKHVYEVDMKTGKSSPLLPGSDRASTFGSVFAVR